MIRKTEAATKRGASKQESFAFRRESFNATCLEFGKKAKDKRLWLIDEYSYFYLMWMEPIKGSINLGNDQNYWLKMHSDPKWRSWSGYAFESLCLKHIAQIKKGLGISF